MALVCRPPFRTDRRGGGGLRLPPLTEAAPVSADPALARLRAGGKRALADMLARIESAPDDPTVQQVLDAAWRAPRGVTIGFTGPPGVGKSTLLSALVGAFRTRDLRVAVLAVDPSSRRSMGALLGDRARIAADPHDPDLFIRSLAARDQLGGLAELAMPIAVLFRSLYDLVLIETVGVGQSETEIADLADLVVFCAQPGSGDSLQFMKAGVVEIPDLAVVCKADLGEAAVRAAADLKGALGLAVRDGPAPEVICASARDGTGIDALVSALVEWPPVPGVRRERQGRSWVKTALRAEFGRAGLRAVAQDLDGQDGQTPFQRQRMAASLLRQRLGLGT